MATPAQEAFLAFVKELPVIGPFTAAAIGLLLAIPAVWRQRILTGVFLIFVYPVLSIAIALVLMPKLPLDARLWLQQNALSNLGGNDLKGSILAAERSDLNATNHIIDGSTLLKFAVGGDDVADNTYIVQLTPNQTVDFATYQSLSIDPTGTSCPTKIDPDADANSDPGHLIVKLVSQSHQDTPTVPENEDKLLQSFYSLDSVSWPQFKPSNRPSGPADFIVKFVPNSHYKYFGCRSFHVYVVMTYVKDDLKG